MLVLFCLPLLLFVLLEIAFLLLATFGESAAVCRYHAAIFVVVVAAIHVAAALLSLLCLLPTAAAGSGAPGQGVRFLCI